MKARLAILGLLTMTGLLGSQPAAQAQSIRIAYIDVEKMVEDSERVRKVIEPLKEKYDAQAIEFEDRKATFEERVRSFRDRADTSDDPTMESEWENLVTEQEDLLRDVKEEARTFAKQQEETLRPLLMEIRRQLQQIGEERNLDFIFRKQDVPYIDEKYDITSEVMDRIDASVAQTGGDE